MPERLVSTFETGGQGHPSVFEPSPHPIAFLVQRGDVVIHKLARYVQHLVHQGGIGVLESGQCCQALRGLQNLVQEELDIGEWGLVMAHEVVLARAAPK